MAVTLTMELKHLFLHDSVAVHRRGFSATRRLEAYLLHSQLLRLSISALHVEVHIVAFEPSFRGRVAWADAPWQIQEPQPKSPQSSYPMALPHGTASR